MDELKIIIGLVGFRCCGKSTLRSIITELNYPVFNTNSVKTGDKDANQISIDQILSRYGDSSSYLLFLKNDLKTFVNNTSGIFFVDSFKVAKDIDVMKELFPDYSIHVWYLHASDQVRLTRYLERDVRTNLRTQNLVEHDQSLEKYGIWELIKTSHFVLNTELNLQEVKKQVQDNILRLKSMYE